MRSRRRPVQCSRKQLTGQKEHDRKKGMVKQSMAEEDTVDVEYDGIMSEDAAEEKEGPLALNTTIRQLRYYYCRKNYLKGCHNTEHTEQKHFSL